MNINNEELQFLTTYVSDRSGLNIDNGKKDALHFSVLSRMTHTQHTNFQQYIDYLKYHPNGHDEFKKLISLITINETRFFRNHSHFAALRDTVIPAIIENKSRQSLYQNQQIAIWSAGCSSGEEPYSIAMTLFDIFGPYHNWHFDILGTDINDNVIKKAQNAVYGKRSLRHTEKRYINRHFTVHQGKYRLKDDLKKMVMFDYHNLADEYYPQPDQGYWDIIFCRNVLIYFKMDVIRRVVQKLYERLAEGGYLYIGFSESLFSISKDFILEQIGDTFVYRKKSVDKEQSPQYPVEITAPAVQKKSLITVSAKNITDRTYKQAYRSYVNEQYESALSLAAQYLEEYPADTRGHLLVGKAFFELGDLKQAMSKLQKVVKLNPMITEAHYYLGIIAYQEKKAVEAVEHLKRAIYTNSDFPMAHYYIASIYHALGDKDKALRSYRNTIQCLKHISGEQALEHAGWLPAKSIIETCRRQIQDLKEVE